MSEQLVVAVVSSMLGSGALTLLVTRVLDRFDNRNPVRQGMRVLLFLKLEHIHREMVEAGEVCPVDVKRTAEQVYAAYHGLGGNGVGTQMIEEIRRAHIEPDPEQSETNAAANVAAGSRVRARD